MIEQASDTLNGLRDDMDGIRKNGADGMDTVRRLEQVDEDVSMRMEVIVRQTNTTNTSAQQIQAATELIASIAEETNLLALNASIEAARAGEQGRGFAVVASQISKLSEDSNKSAKTIENIITQLSADSEASVQIMDEVGEIISEQQRKLDETRNKFRDVSRGIETSMTETETIYAQTKECDEARVRVTDVIQNLSAVAQQNAASTEETNAAMQELNATINLLAEAAKDLKEIAEELEKDVSYFQI